MQHLHTASSDGGAQAPPLAVGSLFAGIGGIDLGLERTGRFRTAWFSEIDPFASAVLRKHWPDVPNLGDVRDIGAGTPRVDLIAGGFPCQPVSLAGKRLAQEDPRWLWPHVARVVGDLRPRIVLLENVPGLRSKGLGDVLEDLSALGYDAEWDGIPASAVGAPHRRDRVWVVAYADSVGRERSGTNDAESGPLVLGRQPQRPDSAEAWSSVPASGLRGLAHGIPHRVERTRAAGNAVVPQVAEVVGRLILDAVDAGRI